MGRPSFFFPPRFFPHVYDDLLRLGSFYQSWALPPATLLGPLVRPCEVEGPGKTGFCVVSTLTSITLVETPEFFPHVSSPLFVCESYIPQTLELGCTVVADKCNNVLTAFDHAPAS